MKSALNLKSFKYIYWLGPFLTLAGITAGLVAGSWGAIAIGLVGAGVGLMVLWLLSQGGDVRSFWSRRSTQVSTNAVLSAIAVLAIFCLANFLAVRYNSRVDLTENRIFTLAPQSQEVTKDLREPVKVWLFETTPDPGDKELLENYRRQSNQFSYEMVDPQAQPGIAQRFGVKGFGEVYLERGEKRELIQTVSPEQRLSERRITNGLVQISSDRQTKVYFLQGHGERPLEAGQGGLSQATDNLKDESYAAEPLNLADKAAIPDDAAVIVVAGPQRPLLAEEVTRLEEYLQRRSGLMLLIDPQTNPELTGLVEEWGVDFSDRVMVDPTAGRDGLVTLITQYGQHPITESLQNGISFYPLARPLELGEVQGVQSVPLLVPNPRTQAQRIGADGNLQPNSATDPQGTLVLGVALSRPAATPSPSPSPSPSPTPLTSPSPSPSPTPTAQGEARLVVIGNSAFITDGLFNQQLNKDMFLNAVNWLSQQENPTLAVRPAELTNRRILLAPAQQLWLVLTALLGLPIIGLVMAGGTWWRRR